MINALIAGIIGMVGSHLADYLLKNSNLRSLLDITQPLLLFFKYIY